MALELIGHHKPHPAQFFVDYPAGNLPKTSRTFSEDFLVMPSGYVQKEIGYWAEKEEGSSGYTPNELMAGMKANLKAGYIALKFLEVASNENKKEQWMDLMKTYRHCLAAAALSCFLRQTTMGDLLMRTQNIVDAHALGFLWNPPQPDKPYKLHLSHDLIEGVAPVPLMRPSSVWHEMEGGFVRSAYPAQASRQLRSNMGLYIGPLHEDRYVTMTAYLAADYGQR